MQASEVQIISLDLRQKRMGMDTPENSVEYKIILMFDLYVPQIDLISFLRDAFCTLD